MILAKCTKNVCMIHWIIFQRQNEHILTNLYLMNCPYPILIFVFNFFTACLKSIFVDKSTAFKSTFCEIFKYFLFNLSKSNLHKLVLKVQNWLNNKSQVHNCLGSTYFVKNNKGDQNISGGSLCQQYLLHLSFTLRHYPWTPSYVGDRR